MKKALLIAALFFLVALGGTSAAMYMVGPAPTAEEIAAADAAAADSAAAVTDSSAVPAALEDAPADSASKTNPENVDSTALNSLAEKSAIASDSSTNTKASAVAAEMTPADRQRLAKELKGAHERFGKIFATMPPEEAAGVLILLHDDVVRGVLLQLPPKKGAAILAHFPAERAASLSAPVLPSFSNPSSSKSRP